MRWCTLAAVCGSVASQHVRSIAGLRDCASPTRRWLVAHVLHRRRVLFFGVSVALVCERLVWCVILKTPESAGMCACVCACMRACASVCVRARARVCSCACVSSVHSRSLLCSVHACCACACACACACGVRACMDSQPMLPNTIQVKESTAAPFCVCAHAASLGTTQEHIVP